MFRRALVHPISGDFPVNTSNTKTRELSDWQRSDNGGSCGGKATAGAGRAVSRGSEGRWRQREEGIGKLRVMGGNETKQDGRDGAGRSGLLGPFAEDRRRSGCQLI